MFGFGRRRSLQANFKLVKDQKSTSEPEETSDIFEGVLVAERYAEIVKDVITHAALTIGGVYVVCKIVERICK